MTCPLCGQTADLHPFAVTGGPDGASVSICQTCADQIEGTPDPDHWRNLASAMWDDVREVQVLAARMLWRLAESAPWARDLADQIYLDDETMEWARAAPQDADASPEHKDCHGATLSQGDTVVLIKDLPVKGAGFTAKRGTAVRGISLVPDNPGQIEGRVEGQRIVILTEFVKKK